MNRLLVLFLLVLMPLQFSWAALADYCHSGQRTLAEHHGHTGHGQATVDTDAAAPADAIVAPVDTPHSAPADTSLSNDHCDPCHGHCLALVRPHGQPPGLSHGSAPVTSLCVTLAGTAATPPERPQWAGLA